MANALAFEDYKRNASNRFRDAGDGDQATDAINRFRDEMRDLGQRWDHRIVLEKSSVAKLYRDGRVDIVLYGDWSLGTNKLKWAASIVADTQPSNEAARIRDRAAVNIGNSNRGQDHIVFINAVELGEHPKPTLSRLKGFYVFEDQTLSVGQGLLYRREIDVGYEVFPRLMERKARARPPRPCFSQDITSEEVERSPEIVYCVADHEGKMLWDRLFGPVGEIITGRIDFDCRTVRFVYPNAVEAGIKRGHRPLDFINVAVGPLNL